MTNLEPTDGVLGRGEQPGRIGIDPAAPKEAKRAWRHAYERGRRDERARQDARALRRRRSPLLGLLVLSIAVMGGAFVYLAASEGSFGRGGEVVDRALGHAADPLKPAAGRAGDALENAGRSLKKASG
jgi:hypothetical protein